MASSSLARMLLEDFLKNSRSCIEGIVKELSNIHGKKERKVRLYNIQNHQKKEIVLNGEHLFLRSSVEYSNPQLTVEEVQGIIAARLLEICGNYFHSYGVHEVDRRDVDYLCEMLINPSLGRVVPFLLNTDDAEPDRYSMNPLRKSILESGQSAFPSASVKTENLKIDQNFMRKYEGRLISREEADLIDRHLESSNNSYLDLVDAVKYEHLEKLSTSFGIDLCIPSMRMPVTVLKKENPDGLLHQIIKKSHRDYEAIERIYACMGRSMKKRTTLLTVPHSKKGYGSKRAARGRIYFEEAKLQRIRVTYRTTRLYPNAIDSDDVSIAKANDRVIIDGEKLRNYDFEETPSSPQFILYSLASPEDAVLWHGIGAFGAAQLVKSFTTTHLACSKELLFKELREKHAINTKIPLQINLVPEKLWFHPKHRNIDASIGCVTDFKDLAEMGMKLKCLSTTKYIREHF